MRSGRYQPLHLAFLWPPCCLRRVHSRARTAGLMMRPARGVWEALLGPALPRRTRRRRANSGGWLGPPWRWAAGVWRASPSSPAILAALARGAAALRPILLLDALCVSGRRASYGCKDARGTQGLRGGAGGGGWAPARPLHEQRPLAWQRGLPSAVWATGCTMFGFCRVGASARTSARSAAVLVHASGTALGQRRCPSKGAGTPAGGCCWVLKALDALQNAAGAQGRPPPPEAWEPPNSPPSPVLVSWLRGAGGCWRLWRTVDCRAQEPEVQGGAG